MRGIGLPELILLAAVLLFFALLIAGVVALVIVVCRQSARGKKVCPFCGEHIQEAAVICRFCNRDLTGMNVPPA